VEYLAEAIARVATEAITLLAFGLVFALVTMLRVRGADRRRRAAKRRQAKPLPVRLRGARLRYPGFWRSGLLDTTTGTFMPRGGWGPSVKLGGARVRSVGVGDRETDNLPPLVDGDALATYVDRLGHVFQLALVDRRDAAFVSRRLTTLPADKADPAFTPLRWVQHRASMTVLVALLAGAVLQLFFLVPLLGAQQVGAEVVENRGPKYLCEVAWSGGHDDAACGDREPGERVDITVLGWPRTGDVDDPETVRGMGLLGVGAVLFFGTVMLWVAADQRRKLRALEGEFARQAR
jgi:hypothetical protein